MEIGRLVRHAKSSHAFIILTADVWESGWHNCKNMNKKLLVVASLIVILLCGCESKAEKKVNELKDLQEKYIEDIDNAKTAEEAARITKEHRERTEFEWNKLSDQEKKEYEQNLSWEEAQELKNIQKKTDDALDRAKERFR